VVSPVRQISYFTNGMFTAAVAAEEFRVERIRPSPSAVLNIASAGWKLVP
jgi:hypothetical protein